MPYSQYGTVDTEHAAKGEDRLGAGRFQAGDRFLYTETNGAGRQCKLDEDTRELFPAESLAPSQRRGLPLTVEAGTVVLMHYDMLHRGSASAPLTLGGYPVPWRPLFKFQFARLREPSMPLGPAPSSTSPSRHSVPRRITTVPFGGSLRLRQTAGAWRPFVDAHRTLPVQPPSDVSQLIPIWEDAYRYILAGSRETGGVAPPTPPSPAVGGANITAAGPPGNASAVGTLLRQVVKSSVLAPSPNEVSLYVTQLMRPNPKPRSALLRDICTPVAAAAPAASRLAAKLPPSSDHSRLAAAHHLGRLAARSPEATFATSAALSALLRAVTNSSEGVGRAAMRGLAVAGAVAVAPLTKALTNASSPNASALSPVSRRHIAQALGDAASAPSVPRQAVGAALLVLSALVAAEPSPADPLDVSRVAAAEAIGLVLPVVLQRGGAVPSGTLSTTLSALINALHGPSKAAVGGQFPLQQAAAFSLLQLLDAPNARHVCFGLHREKAHRGALKAALFAIADADGPDRCMPCHPRLLRIAWGLLHACTHFALALQPRLWPRPTPALPAWRRLSQRHPAPHPRHTLATPTPTPHPRHTHPFRQTRSPTCSSPFGA